MKRLVSILMGLTLLACAGAAALTSTAAFTYGSVSTVTASAETASQWLHLYSSATDPDGDTGYATRANYTPVTPAATGQDATIAVHAGCWNDTTAHNVIRTLKIKAPPSFPDGVTSVNVTLTRIADPATGRQPITTAGVDTWGATSWTTSVTGWLPNVKRQLNLRIKYASSWTKRQYIPIVRLTVTYSGFSSTYYTYDIPVKCNYGVPPGPN